MRKRILSALSLALLLSSGCGYHLVSYNPKEAATISQEMLSSFRRYREMVQPRSETESADVDEVGALFEENCAKNVELLRQ